MGKRARKRGVTTSMVRRARREHESHDKAAAKVAQRVYNVVHEAKETGEAGDVSPLLWAPLVVASELAAVVIAKSQGLDSEDEELLTDIAAYFVAGMLAGVQGFDREHFEAWREAASTAAQEGAHEQVEPG